MDFVKSIEDFFDLLEEYIILLIGYVGEADILALLQYLFLCIPEELRAILIVFLLLMLVLGVRKIFSGS